MWVDPGEMWVPSRDYGYSSNLSILDDGLLLDYQSRSCETGTDRKGGQEVNGMESVFNIGVLESAKNMLRRGAHCKCEMTYDLSLVLE